MTYYLFKRFCDFVLAFALVLACSPLLIVISACICIDIGRPIVFRQLRPGYRGVPFYLLKFRTMSQARGLDGRLLPDADRLSRFGRFLRSSSLDELPSLLNILFGQISFIGPRPLLMQYLSLYTVEQFRRHEVMPGLSGWAQINGRNNLSWEEKFDLDVWYVDRQNFLLDLRILLFTLWKVVLREGISADGHATVAPFSGSATSSDAG